MTALAAEEFEDAGRSARLVAFCAALLAQPCAR
jgi:hypothetical protein